MEDDVLGSALGGLFGAGVSAVTGNPVGAGMALAGAGLSIFGSSQKASNAREIANVQKQMAGVEMQQDAVRRRMMEMSARRQQMEVLRNAQRARSLALAVANSQGAQFGSGLQGGYGQISGQTNTNLLGIDQGLKAGEQMFDLNAVLSKHKMTLADLGGKAATSEAYTKLGGTLLGSASAGGNLGKQFGLTFSGGSSGSMSNSSNYAQAQNYDTWNG